MSDLCMSYKVMECDEGQAVQTIPSYEVAKMIGKEHKEVLQYIEGRTNKEGKILVTGIIPVLLSEDLHPVKYFMESTYKDSTGKENKCYEVTKMGCEMLANKQQGAKGILFTAKYVKRFNEMENMLNQHKLPGTYKEALKKLLVQVEENEKLEEEKRIAEGENIKLSKIIESQKPKVEYADKILSCKDAMLVTNIAFDYGLSAKALNKILCEERVQRKVRNQYILYSEYMGKGYTETETSEYGGKARPQTLWTQKGRMLIHQILKQRNIKPLEDIVGGK